MASGTDGESSRCTFEWKIENISHCFWLKKAKKIGSIDFIASRLGGTKWSLSLYPLGHTDENISLYLNRKKGECQLEVIEVYYKLAFLGKDGSILTEKTSAKSSFKVKETQGFSTFEDRKTVFVTSRNIFLPEDTLTIQCTLWSPQYIPSGGCIPYRVEVKGRPEYKYARTVVSVKRSYFDWNIDKINNLESPAHQKTYEDDDDLISFNIFINGKSMDELILDEISFDSRLKYFSCNVSVINSVGKRENCGIGEYTRSDLEMVTQSFKLPHFERFRENKDQYFPNDVLSFEFIFTTVLCAHMLY